MRRVLELTRLAVIVRKVGERAIVGFPMNANFVLLLFRAFSSAPHLQDILLSMRTKQGC
jgi:hypothetical protein